MNARLFTKQRGGTFAQKIFLHARLRELFCASQFFSLKKTCATKNKFPRSRFGPVDKLGMNDLWSLCLLVVSGDIDCREMKRKNDADEKFLRENLNRQRQRRPSPQQHSIFGLVSAALRRSLAGGAILLRSFGLPSVSCVHRECP